jgi:hypothetical protein
MSSYLNASVPLPRPPPTLDGKRRKARLVETRLGLHDLLQLKVHAPRPDILDYLGLDVGVGPYSRDAASWS